MGGVESKWRRLGDKLRGLEVILQIWRLAGNVFMSHGASAPPPQRISVSKLSN